MRKVAIDKERCKSCGYCVALCPKKAIAFSSVPNTNGYKYVVIDTELCVGCGACYWCCPDSVYELGVA